MLLFSLLAAPPAHALAPLVDVTHFTGCHDISINAPMLEQWLEHHASEAWGPPAVVTLRLGAGTTVTVNGVATIPDNLVLHVEVAVDECPSNTGTAYIESATPYEPFDNATLIVLGTDVAVGSLGPF